MPTARFKPAERVEPNEVVIVQGLHPFLLPGIREAFDLKVWLDPETALRIRWKLQRDIAKRGYNESQVRAEIEARRVDAEAHIEPQRKQADLVVRFSSPNEDLSPGTTDHLNVRLTQRHSMPQLAFEHALDNGTTVRVRNDIADEDGRQSDVIEIDGRISAEDAARVERRCGITRASAITICTISAKRSSVATTNRTGAGTATRSD